MKLTRFFIVQALALGSCAFVAWALLASRGTWPLRFSLDTIAALGAGIALTALFLLVVAWPVQLAIRGQAPLVTRIVAGLVSGPVGVWLGLVVLSSYPVNWDWYVSRAWALHSVYAGIGLCFALAWHRRLRPNNSFKPNPLRGSA